MQGVVVEAGRGQEVSRVVFVMKSGIGWHGMAGLGSRGWLQVVLRSSWLGVVVACVREPQYLDWADGRRTLGWLWAVILSVLVLGYLLLHGIWRKCGGGRRSVFPIV